MNLSTWFKKKLVIHTLLIFIGLFSVFQCVNADLIDTTRSGEFKISRCRNVVFYHISHNQVFRPGDSINFGFTAICKNPAISCGTAQASAFLSGTRWNSYDGYTMFDYPYLNLIGTGSHSGNPQLSCTDVGDGWARIGVANLIAEIPSNLSVAYTAAGVYPIFAPSGRDSGWNIGSLGEHIQISFPSCSLPWGGTIDSGSSVTAYQDSSVPCGSTCSSETRTCSNGTLSGSYTNSSCSIGVCCFCSADYYYVPDYSTTECIGARGVCSSNCKKITTGNCPDSGIFVPTKTTSEWNEFLSNLPSCTSVTSCN